MGLFAGWAPGVSSKDMISSQQMRTNLDKPVFKIERKDFKELKLTKAQRFCLFFLKLIDSDYVNQIYSKIKEINYVNKFDYVENKWYGHDPDKEFECAACGKIFQRSNIKFNLCEECSYDSSENIQTVNTKSELPEIAFTIGEMRYVEEENCSYVYMREGWIKIQKESSNTMVSASSCEDCGATINEFNSYIYIVNGVSHPYCSKCFIKHRKSGEKVNFTSTWGKI